MESETTLELETSRFGQVGIQAEDILVFPNGLIGLEDAKHWVLLADMDHESLGWLQAVGNADLALPVVSPRRYVPDYRVRLFRRQLDSLQLGDLDQAYVLVIVGREQDEFTVNLRAPLIINLDRHVGRQVITNDEQPTQARLWDDLPQLRKSA